MSKELAFEGLNNTVEQGETYINPRYISGIDEILLKGLKAKHKIMVTLESSQKDGGLGQKISAFYGTSDMEVINVGAKKKFTDKIPYDEFFKNNILTKEQIV